jgi:hypothetical protein
MAGTWRTTLILYSSEFRVKALPGNIKMFNNIYILCGELYEAIIKRLM